MRSSNVKQILFFVFVFMAAAFEQVLTYRSLGLCFSTIIAAFPSHYITGGDIVGVMLGE